MFDYQILNELNQMSYKTITYVNILNFQQHKPNHLKWDDLFVYVKFIIPMFLEEETLEKYVPFRVETWFFTLSSVTFRVICLTMRWTLHENYLFCLWLLMCVCLCVLQHQKFFEMLLLSYHSSFRGKYIYYEKMILNGMECWSFELNCIHFIFWCVQVQSQNLTNNKNVVVLSFY